ncbi:helix-turn-helix transcriptional regulator [Mycobacteroides chelonae]|uniref:helix-turn-helix transcriptional regulator n=1 Tax=Mycobacteroides chelonae TaxID=1774 RepID=UPI003204F18E
MTQVVAANVRAEMARGGWNQSKLAPALKMSQQALSERLRGRVAFDVNEIGAIASVLGVRVSVLMPTEAVAS